VLALIGGAHGEPAPVRLAERFVTCQTPNGERYQANDHCMAGDSIVQPCFLSDGSVRWVRSARECEALGGSSRP
jgi:hypothetical protein